MTETVNVTGAAVRSTRPIQRSAKSWITPASSTSFERPRRRQVWRRWCRDRRDFGQQRERQVDSRRLATIVERHAQPAWLSSWTALAIRIPISRRTRAFRFRRRAGILHPDQQLLRVAGNNAGAMVNVVTRSGTNEFTAAIRVRAKPGLQRAQLLLPATGLPEAKSVRGVCGGPVSCRATGRNKTFFFIGWQGTRIRNQANSLSLLPAPTIDQRTGDFGTHRQPRSARPAGRSRTIKFRSAGSIRRR